MPHESDEDIEQDKERDTGDHRIQARRHVKDKNEQGLLADHTECGAGPPDQTLVPLVIRPLSDFSYPSFVLARAQFLPAQLAPSRSAPVMK